MTDLTSEQLAELAHIASLDVTSATQEDMILRAAPQLIVMARRTAEAEGRAELAEHNAKAEYQRAESYWSGRTDLERRLAEAKLLAARMPQLVNEAYAIFEGTESAAEDRLVREVLDYVEQVLRLELRLAALAATQPEPKQQ